MSLQELRRRDVDAGAEDPLGLQLERQEVEQRVVRIEIYEEIDVARLRRISASDGPEDTHMADAVGAGRFEQAPATTPERLHARARRSSYLESASTRSEQPLERAQSRNRHSGLVPRQGWLRGGGALCQLGLRETSPAARAPDQPSHVHAASIPF